MEEKNDGRKEGRTDVTQEDYQGVVLTIRSFHAKLPGTWRRELETRPWNKLTRNIGSRFLQLAPHCSSLSSSFYAG